MQTKTAERVLSDLAPRPQDANYERLRTDFINAGVRYARLRVDWLLADREERIATKEGERSRAHEAVIDSANILSRYMAKNAMDNSWRERLGADRREIGDFACHLHCLLGLRAR